MKNIGVSNQPGGKVHYFDDLFAALQFQKQTPHGRKWLTMPMPLYKYPDLTNKKTGGKSFKALE